MSPDKSPASDSTLRQTGFSSLVLGTQLPNSENGNMLVRSAVYTIGSSDFKTQSSNTTFGDGDFWWGGAFELFLHSKNIY